MPTFLEQARAGTVGADDVDDFVARWHAGDGEGTLREFLGLTDEEYGRWLLEPSVLDEIIGGSEHMHPRRRTAI